MEAPSGKGTRTLQVIRNRFNLKPIAACEMMGMAEELDDPGGKAEGRLSSLDSTCSRV